MSAQASTDTEAGTSGPIAIAGYASLDYAMNLAPFRGVDATTIVRSRAEVWPRVGGIAHVTSAIAKASHAPVMAISWIGPDAGGDLWRDEVAATGVHVSGVIVDGTRSPTSHLFYPDDGGTICIFDPADCHPSVLPEAQADDVRAADWLILTVGPEAPTRSILDTLKPSTKLVWVVKHDSSSVPADLRARILRRADVITLSENERDFVQEYLGELRAGSFVIETCGSRGARVFYSGADGLLEQGAASAAAVHDVDTTGAGDTFTGTLVAALAEAGTLSVASTLAALNLAASATADMLLQRKQASSLS